MSFKPVRRQIYNLVQRAAFLEQVRWRPVQC